MKIFVYLVLAIALATITFAALQVSGEHLLAAVADFVLQDMPAPRLPF